MRYPMDEQIKMTGLQEFDATQRPGVQ